MFWDTSRESMELVIRHARDSPPKTRLRWSTLDRRNSGGKCLENEQTNRVLNDGYKIW